jgi:hypothetical protein
VTDAGLCQPNVLYSQHAHSAASYRYASPGGFNDPCLLISTSDDGTALATEQQSRAQFSMSAILTAPLLISGNIRNMSNFTLETYVTSHNATTAKNNYPGTAHNAIA